MNRNILHSFSHGLINFRKCPTQVGILFYWSPIARHLGGQLPFSMVALGHKCRLSPVDPQVGSHPMSSYHLETQSATVATSTSSSTTTNR